MCIVLLTTAHPSYALIVIDNRDEFILRPTSRPHWWTHPAANNPILSSRDLQRPEKGTWLAVSRDGNLAVLTNYREMDSFDAAHPIHGIKSRGAMVTAWVGMDARESTHESVQRLIDGGRVKGVGGFSMLCGKLRRRPADGEDGLKHPFAVVCNRNDHVDQVPFIASHRGEVHGLSNTAFDDKDTWPKLEDGKRLLAHTVRDAVANDLPEESLIENLFSVLATDNLPRQEGKSLNDYVPLLKHSIFVPPIGDALDEAEMKKASEKGPREWSTECDPATLAQEQAACASQHPASEDVPATNQGFATGMYGTQRQTVLLVDWDGNVTFCERALWDANGNPLDPGRSEVRQKFRVEGWNPEEDSAAGERAEDVCARNEVRVSA